MKKVTIIVATLLFAFATNSIAQSKPVETIATQNTKTKGVPLSKPVVGAKYVQGSGDGQQNKKDSARRYDVIGQFPKN